MDGAAELPFRIRPAGWGRCVYRRLRLFPPQIRRLRAIDVLGWRPSAARGWWVGSGAERRRYWGTIGMSDYKTLETRLAAREVVILDGAVGTQLQKMGVPMNGTAWAALALQTHPYQVRQLHELYIRAGVDIITVNSYSAARHNLAPLGLGDMTRELNLRAVSLAQEARDRRAK